MRYLAIDLGDKRTGLAVGDDVTHIVTPIDVLHAPRVYGDAPLLEALRLAIERYAPAALVIGLPINMDDSEGAAAEAVRQFGDVLARASGLPIHFQDERLTSFAAEQQLTGTGRTRQEKRELIDALAAAQILRDFLAARTPESQRSSPPRDDDDEHDDECG